MHHFAALDEADHSVARGWCLDALRELYQRALQIGDFGTALKAVKELAKLAQ